MSPNVLPFVNPRQRPAAELLTTTVLGLAGERFLLADAVHVSASRAVGCLVEPQVGDTVLAVHDAATGDTHVLSVLVRPQTGATGVAGAAGAAGAIGTAGAAAAADAAGPAGSAGVAGATGAAGGPGGTLVLPGGSRLHDHGGTLAVTAAALRLGGQREVSIEAPALEVSAATAQVRVTHGHAWFDSLESYAVNVALTARSLSSRVGRLMQRAVESFRSVDNLDETRAGRVRVEVQGHHQVQAGHISAQAEGFVRIDGRKIDLG